MYTEFKIGKTYETVMNEIKKENSYLFSDTAKELLNEKKLKSDRFTAIYNGLCKEFYNEYGYFIGKVSYKNPEANVSNKKALQADWDALVEDSFMKLSPIVIANAILNEANEFSNSWKVIQPYWKKFIFIDKYYPYWKKQMDMFLGAERTAIYNLQQDNITTNDEGFAVHEYLCPQYSVDLSGENSEMIINHFWYLYESNDALLKTDLHVKLNEEQFRSVVEMMSKCLFSPEGETKQVDVDDFSETHIELAISSIAELKYQLKHLNCSTLFDNMMTNNGLIKNINDFDENQDKMAIDSPNTIPTI